MGQCCLQRSPVMTSSHGPNWLQSSSCRIRAKAHTSAVLLPGDLLKDQSVGYKLGRGRKHSFLPYILVRKQKGLLKSHMTWHGKELNKAVGCRSERPICKSGAVKTWPNVFWPISPPKRLCLHTGNCLSILLQLLKALGDGCSVLEYWWGP